MEPEAVTPFQEVLKDGYYDVDCIKDFMFEHGDKFGDGKFAYQLGDTANVSIVHYSLLVKVEDQEPMTPDVCFKFCRTVPDMMFFGITHGRECYCAPYYKAVAGDSSSCDAVCEGDNTLMCGGMTKSSLFEMHACSDAAEDVADAAGKMTSLKAIITEKSAATTTAATNMQSAADVMQTAFGKVGDSAATGLLQSAKVFAGELEKAAGTSSKLVQDMAALEASASSTGSVSGFDAVSAAEALTADIESAVVKGEAAVEELEGLLAKATPAGGSNASAVLYYPVMYFVDKAFKDVPSTCAGTSAGEPIYGTFETCASACDAAVGSCVGFSFLAYEADGLCFLFSKMTSATYYTGCGGAANFLQKAKSLAVATDTKCVAKFEDFEGTTLKPDPSGKCEKCLKSATKADRCFT